MANWSGNVSRNEIKRQVLLDKVRQKILRLLVRNIQWVTDVGPYRQLPISYTQDRTNCLRGTQLPLWEEPCYVATDLCHESFPEAYLEGYVAMMTEFALTLYEREERRSSDKKWEYLDRPCWAWEIWTSSLIPGKRLKMQPWSTRKMETNGI